VSRRGLLGDGGYPAAIMDNSGQAMSVRREACRIRLVCSLGAATIMAVALMLVPSGMLRDPDNLWHVRVGLDILGTHSLPSVDTYSYTFAGHPWIAKEWLAQIAFALAYAAAGWTGIALLTMAAFTTTVFLLSWYLTANFRPTVALGVGFVLIFFFTQMYNARPYVLTFPILVIWTAELFRASRDELRPPLWLLPMMTLWANLHAAFTFGFIIALFAFIDLLVRVRLSKRALLARWVLFGLACPLAALINPYGLKAILATFTVAFGNEALAHISEWQPFDAETMPFPALGILAVFLIFMGSKVSVSWTRAIFVLLLLYLFLIHIRFLYLLVLVAPIAIAYELSFADRSWSYRRWVREPRDPIERFITERFRWTVAGLIALSLAAGGAFVAVARPHPSAETLAEGGMTFVKEHGISGNVINSYSLGGTLILHGIKTYVDGRSDQLFLGGFIKRDQESAETSGRAVLNQILNQYDIRWAFLVKDDDRIPFFDELEGWRRVYKDDFCLVYVREN
jgi:hypothetical protein